MKTKSLALRLGIVFGCFLAQGVAWNQPAYGDCESDRFDAFLDADSQYTSTFRSWYLGAPVSCDQECEDPCFPRFDVCTNDCLFNQQCEAACEVQLNGCMNYCIDSCVNVRYAAYTSAQDALMEVASRTCPFGLDECAAARARRYGCVANFNGYMANPVYDENGNVDFNWQNFVFGEYGACIAASGVEHCE